MPITRRRLRAAFDIDGTIVRGANESEFQRNVELFHQLSTLFEEVYIITSRSEEMREITEKNLRNWKIRYHKLIMTEDRITKSRVCAEHKVDIMFEDDLAELCYFEAHEQYRTDHNISGHNTLYLGLNTGWKYSDLRRHHDFQNKGLWDKLFNLFSI